MGEANATWPITTMKTAKANTSWTKVAPVRHETGSAQPLHDRTGGEHDDDRRPVNAAFSFGPD